MIFKPFHYDATGCAAYLLGCGGVGVCAVVDPQEQDIESYLHFAEHTPESVCLVVSDLRRGPDPWFVCTGDTLFVGAVGRPDLPGHERENAAELRRSLHEKLLRLAPEIELYPAHYAGSACGAGMSGKPMTTLAFEKRYNPLLTLPEAEFVSLLSERGLPKPAEMAATLSYNQGRSEQERASG